MKQWNPLKFMQGAMVAGALAIPILANGCSDNPLDAVCCKEFTPGAAMLDVDFGVDASIKGQYATMIQASADMSAAATAMLQDVEASCRSLAVDLGAKEDDPSVVGKTGAAGANAWCALAAAQVKGFVAIAGQLTIVVKPPVCSASIKAKAECTGKCDVNAKCDIKATPPTCKGGKLEVACKGECTAKAGATLSCEGECTTECKGTCTAKGGVAVACDGKCEGTCAATGGSGIQPDGSCKGTCNGQCTMRADAPAVKCDGTCNGTCTGSCKGSAEVSVRCDGECKADYEPLRCEGGTLEGGCQVDAQCNVNCDASVNAKAECTPPEVTITASGTITDKVNVGLAALEKNLPNLLLVFKARGQAFVDLVVSFSGSVKVAVEGTLSGKVGVKGSACGFQAVNAALQAADNAKAAFAGSASVAGELKL